MGERRSIHDELNDLLTCPVCLEVKNSQKLMLCQHTLCVDCLAELDREQRKFRCPTCNKVNIPVRQACNVGVMRTYCAWKTL